MRITVWSFVLSMTVACKLQAAAVWSENFDSLAGILVDNVSEGIVNIGTDNPVPNVWSPSPPSGWTVDNSKMPTGGVQEWRGWSFAKADWWSEIASSGELRPLFPAANGGSAVGVIAIADSDEWADATPRGVGRFESYLVSPAINVAGQAAGSLQLDFVASWRPEGDQTGIVEVSYDNGATYTEIKRFSSDAASPSFVPSIPAGDLFSVPLDNPNGSSQATVRFGYWGDNNWWWGLDDLGVVPTGGGTALFSENWESVTLQENVQEGRAIPKLFPNSWTHTPPSGWTITNDLPGIGDPAVGITEWEGWSFVTPEFWLAADGQRRGEFTRGTGVIAVADPDEWDDFGNPDSLGLYNTLLETGDISLAGVASDNLTLRFDSSWRDEAFDDFPAGCSEAGVLCTNNQTAVVRVSFDGGAPIEVLKWDSDPNSPTFKNDNPNEGVSLTLAKPAGATTMSVTFGLLTAANDWWWAIDNVRLLDGTIAPADLNEDGRVDGADAALVYNTWNTNGIGDIDLSGVTDGADLAAVFAAWTGDSVATTTTAVPEPALGLPLVAAGLFAGRLRLRRS